MIVPARVVRHDVATAVLLLFAAGASSGCALSMALTQSGDPVTQEVNRERAAIAVSALKAPLNGAVCALGAATGLVAMALTLGTQPQVAWSFVEEGCSQKRLLTAEDLRPRAAAGPQLPPLPPPLPPQQ